VKPPANQNRRVAEKSKISQEMWILKAQFAHGTVLFVPYEAKPLIYGALCEELNRIFKKLSYKGRDLGSLGAGQSDMGKEWMAFE
jgi:hypothetical protein